MYTNSGETEVPSARPPAHRIICAINGYFIYIVRIVPLGLFTPASGGPGRSVWTGDYTNGWGAGRGKEARLETGLRATARGGPAGKAEQASLGPDL